MEAFLLPNVELIQHASPAVPRQLQIFVEAGEKSRSARTSIRKVGSAKRCPFGDAEGRVVGS